MGYNKDFVIKILIKLWRINTLSHNTNIVEINTKDYTYESSKYLVIKRFISKENVNQGKIMNEFRNENKSNKDEIHKNLWSHFISNSARIEF